MTSNLPADFYLNKVLAFIDAAVYCRDEYKWALTCALAVESNKHAFGAVPFILATGEKPGSGKSTIAFDIPMMLGWNVESIDRTTTQPALNAMYLQRETPDTAWDDVGKIFGANGTNGATSNFYTLLVKSYKNNATTKLSRNGAMMVLSTYGMAFLNGLFNAVPLDLFTRCIHFKMEEAPDGLELADLTDNIVEVNAKILREALHSWSVSQTDFYKAFMKGPVKRIHPKLGRRRRQKWGPLFAVAHAAGGQWPQRIFDAFVAVELGAGERPDLVPEQSVLLDAAKIILKAMDGNTTQDDLKAVFTADLIAALQALPEGSYYREADDEYLAKTLFPVAFGPDALVTSVMRYGEHAGQRGKARGYNAIEILQKAADLRDLLYPPMDTDIKDPMDEYLAFTPAAPTPLVMAGRTAA